MKNKTQTEQILTVLHIIAWVACIGFMIEAGAMLFSYVVTLINPAAAKNLYKGLDLSSIYQFNLWHYSAIVSFLVAIPVMKSIVWLHAINILSKISMENPFRKEVAKRLETISVILFGIWIVDLIHLGYASWIIKRTGIGINASMEESYLFLAGLIFIISQVFKRGVEIQSENELTV